MARRLPCRRRHKYGHAMRVFGLLWLFFLPLPNQNPGLERAPRRSCCSVRAGAERASPRRRGRSARRLIIGGQRSSAERVQGPGASAPRVQRGRRPARASRAALGGRRPPPQCCGCGGGYCERGAGAGRGAPCSAGLWDAGRQVPNGRKRWGRGALCAVTREGRAQLTKGARLGRAARSEVLPLPLGELLGFGGLWGFLGRHCCGPPLKIGPR